MTARHARSQRLRHGPAAQRGVSMGAVMIVLVLIVFFVTLAVNMVPSYLTFMQVKGVMESVLEKPEVIKAGPQKIMKTLSSQLGIEGIKTVTPGNFAFVKGDRGTELKVAYEVRKHLFFNVDVLMDFQHSVLLREP